MKRRTFSNDALNWPSPSSEITVHAVAEMKRLFDARDDAFAARADEGACPRKLENQDLVDLPFQHVCAYCPR